MPTPQEVVEGMLELAQVKRGEVVYDLGSGDGRIVVTAAKKYGAQAVGFEIDPERIMESREGIRQQGLERLAEIREQDILTVDLSQANVLTMYLLSSVNLKLRPKILREMAPARGSCPTHLIWEIGNPTRSFRLTAGPFITGSCRKEVL